MNGKLPRITGATLIVAVAAFIGFWLLRVGTGTTGVSTGLQMGALILGLVLFVGAAAALYRSQQQAPVTIESRELAEPAFARFLFSSPRSAPLWLGMRLYLGYEWLEAGWGKVTDAAWMDGGAALQGFWERAVAIP